MNLIIDDNIVTWTTTAEAHTNALQRSVPLYEREHREKREAALEVLRALRRYEEVCDKYASKEPIAA
jgi:hypothetical protein